MRSRRSGAIALIHLLPAMTQAFVVTGINSSVPTMLPTMAARWHVPTSVESTEGLGGGLAWVLDDDFCAQMISRFPERSFVRGLELPAISFVSCEEIKAAIQRGFDTWSANHRLISFTDISTSTPCESHSADTSDPCPWELYVSTDDGETHPKLAAYVQTHHVSSADQAWFERTLRSSAGMMAHGVDANYRSVMRFQTHLCWYLDATFCYYFHHLEERHSIDVGLLVRLVLAAVFGVAALRVFAMTFWILVALFCLRAESTSKVRKRRCCSTSCSVVLDYLSSLSPCANVLVLFCLTFPPVFYDRIFLPCAECYDFEAAIAHEAGHVLGFGHPDQRPAENLIAAAGCAITNATCRDPFSCAITQRYDEGTDTSIMHSLTQHSPRTCLSHADLEGLHFLYPLCDDLGPTSVSCVKPQRLSGWLRLAIVAGVPFLLAVVLILVPLTCLRCREQRRMAQLDRDLGDANLEIQDYKQTVQLMRQTVREAVRPMTAALQRQASNRPSTAALIRAVQSTTRPGAPAPKARRVHPMPTAASEATCGGGAADSGGAAKDASSPNGSTQGGGACGACGAGGAGGTRSVAKPSGRRGSAPAEVLILEDVADGACVAAGQLRVKPSKLQDQPFAKNSVQLGTVSHLPPSTTAGQQCPSEPQQMSTVYQTPSFMVHMFNR